MNAKMISIFLLFTHCSMVKNAAGRTLTTVKDNTIEGSNDGQHPVIATNVPSIKTAIKELLKKLGEMPFPTIEQLKEIMGTDMEQKYCMEFVTNENGIISMVDSTPTPLLHTSAYNALFKMIITDMEKRTQHKNNTDLYSTILGYKNGQEPLIATTVPSFTNALKETLLKFGDLPHPTKEQFKEIMGTDMEQKYCMEFVTNENGIISEVELTPTHAFLKMIITDLMDKNTDIYSIIGRQENVSRN